MEKQKTVLRLIGFVVAATIAAPAIAQDEPRFAVVASLPTPTVSFQWEVTNWFALRLDGSYNFREESYAAATGASFFFFDSGASMVTETHTELTSHTGSLGVAGLFTVHRGDALRLYVAPEVSMAFSRGHTAITTTTSGDSGNSGFIVIMTPSTPTGTQVFDYSSTSPGAGVSFGAAAHINRHLGVFGETGFTYFRTSDPPLIVPSIGEFIDRNRHRTTLGTHAVAGVMIRF